jgi:uncharacterized protein
MRIAALLVLISAGAASHAASFDCAKAATATEKLICANQRISDLDEYLGRYFYTARAEVGRGAQCLVPNQRGWLRTVRDACKDAACLERVYLNRLAELDPLQLGATALKNENLPDVKALVWAIGPELDKVAAPAPKTHVPLVVTGKIVNDQEGGNGYVVQDAKGAKFILLPAMFVDKSNYMALEGFTQEEPRIYEARGELNFGYDTPSNASGLGTEGAKWKFEVKP